MLSQLTRALLNFITTFLDVLVRGFLVPGVLLLLLLIAWLIAFRTYSSDPGQRISRILAFLFGVVLFATASVSTFFVQQLTAIQFQGTPGDFLKLFVLGTVIGVVIMVSIDKLLKSQAASIFVAVLSFASLTGLYFYALAAQSRNPVLVIVLGLLAGGLFYGAFIHVPVGLSALQIRNLGRTTLTLAVIVASLALTFTALALAQGPNGFQFPNVLATPTKTVPRTPPPSRPTSTPSG